MRPGPPPPSKLSPPNLHLPEMSEKETRAAGGERAMPRGRSCRAMKDDTERTLGDRAPPPELYLLGRVRRGAQTTDFEKHHDGLKSCGETACVCGVYDAAAGRLCGGRTHARFRSSMIQTKRPQLPGQMGTPRRVRVDKVPFGPFRDRLCATC
ncbi:hypothetical protein LX36DRAFT_231476 [Colletotrichum falcatum]|nr:hypothetical protein LX36DRAFT_231476 [Colletotrichum falcatum]